jgi:hypothetical protein
MKKTLLATSLLVLSNIAMADIVATPLYYNDFDGSQMGSSTLSGGVLTGTQDFAALTNATFGETFYMLDPTLAVDQARMTFNFTGLQEHHAISLGGLAAIINSWDSTDAGDASSPDYFSVLVDGVAVVNSLTFANTQGTVNDHFGSVLTGESFGFGTSPTLWTSGTDYEGWGEQAFDFNNYAPLQNIQHSGDNLEVVFVAHGAGWQGGDDESFAIDNFNVTTHSFAADVPFVGGGILSLIGLLALGRRRR